MRKPINTDHLLSYMRENFTYNKDSGLLIRKSTGKPCLSRNSQGYLDVDLGKVFGKRVRNTRVHCLVWLMQYEEWPNGVIDHVDGDKSNNRLSNLRLASQATNQMNSMSRKGSKSKFKGVGKHACGKWRAYIGVGNKKTKHLGLFNCETAAAFAYDKAARSLFKDFARLNFPMKGEQSAVNYNNYAETH